MTHVFISYVRDDGAIVDRLCSDLRSAGVEIWIDRDSIAPGKKWRQSIRNAIQQGTFFIACFSHAYLDKRKTFMNEELMIAIDELRQRPADRIWFIPVRLSECDIPERAIGGDESLRDLQWVSLFDDWDYGVKRILGVITSEGAREAGPLISPRSCETLRETDDVVSGKSRVGQEACQELEFANSLLVATARELQEKRTSYARRLALLPRWRWRVALVVLVILVAVMAFSLMVLMPGPNIERLLPIDPVAGGKLQVFGHNFPDKSSLVMRIGHNPVSEIDVSTPDYLEVRVPPEATSGPVVVTKKRRVLPDQRVVYPVTSVQNLARDVVLLTEDIRETGAGIAVQFSVLNTSKQRKITINDVRLETVLVQDLSGPTYQQERIDLGVHGLFDDHAHETTLDLLTQDGVRLTDSTFKLPPMSSDSFQFMLTSPLVQHHMRLVFFIVIKFFDDTGATGQCYSNRLFSFETSDDLGISESENLPLDRFSIDKLEQKYGVAVRDFEWEQ